MSRADFDLELLRDFFGAYFHEDWTCDSNTTEEVVNDYKKTSTKPQRITLSQDILKYVDSLGSENRSEDFLQKELGCYYLPSSESLTPKLWLERVAEQLRLE